MSIAFRDGDIVVERIHKRRPAWIGNRRVPGLLVDVVYRVRTAGEDAAVFSDHGNYQDAEQECRRIAGGGIDSGTD